MSVPFFSQAMISPGRQSAFRRAAIFHLIWLTLSAWAVIALPARYLPHTLGDALMILGIIEGAALIGWRLVQLPKSQALEFLLVSPVSERLLFLAEGTAGIGRLALICLCGLPLLVVLTVAGRIEWCDVPALILLPLIWGTVAGLGLTVWAYEHMGIRRWGERIGLVLIIAYLVIGVLAAERLRNWLGHLPAEAGQAIYSAVLLFTQYNPFGAIEYWLSADRDSELAFQTMQVLFAYSIFILMLFLSRAADPLKCHFHV